MGEGASEKGGTRTTNTVLDKIVAKKREEVGALRSAGYARGGKRHGGGRIRDFAAALRDRAKPGRPIIAEIKKASPSAGVIRDPFLPAEIARGYEQSHARCVSVITDESFFQGSLDYLREVRSATNLPVIRKDFIIDPAQLDQAWEAGADCALLIARILGDGLYAHLYAHARSLGLAVLFEVHDLDDLERTVALDPEPAMIGVNNRDLSDFTVSVERTIELLPEMPEGALVVSESGLGDPAELDRLLAAGVGAFLIGTSLMKSDDPGEALKRLVY